MPNTFSINDVIPQMLAQGVLALREYCPIPMLANRDYGIDAAQKGATIQVPIPSAMTAADVVPSNTPPVPSSAAPTSVSITLDNWKYVDFHLTDKQQMEVSTGVLPMQAAEAIKSLANAINTQVLSNYKAFFGYTGTAGTTPFGTGVEILSGTGARTNLNKQLAPMSDRRFLLNPDAEGMAMGLRNFQDVNFGVSVDDIMKGRLAEKFGFSWWMSQLMPTHTAGTITTGLIAKAATAQAVGLKAIACTTAASTGACALVEGDIITFAGHTQTYALTAAATQAAAATAVTLDIYPGLKTALAGSEAITVKASHVVNMAFHRDAFVFASRPLEQTGRGLGPIVESITDPESGMSLRLQVSRQHMQTVWTWDALWGSKVVRPELGTRLAG